MKIERRFLKLIESVLKHEICSKDYLLKIIDKLTRATYANDPTICPADLFIYQENTKELPNPLYLALVKLKCIVPHSNVDGTLIGFTWNADYSSHICLPNFILPKASKQPMTGLIDSKFSETIKNSLVCLKENTNFIMLALNKVHTENFYDLYANVDDDEIEWPLVDVLSNFKSYELGVSFNFIDLYKKTFPDEEDVKKKLLELPNTLYNELIHRSFLVELRKAGWQVSFVKSLYNSNDIKGEKIVLLNIGIV